MYIQILSDPYSTLKKIKADTDPLLKRNKSWIRILGMIGSFGCGFPDPTWRLCPNSCPTSLFSDRFNPDISISDRICNFTSNIPTGTYSGAPGVAIPTQLGGRVQQLAAPTPKLEDIRQAQLTTQVCFLGKGFNGLIWKKQRKFYHGHYSPI